MADEDPDVPGPDRTPADAPGAAGAEGADGAGRADAADEPGGAGGAHPAEPEPPETMGAAAAALARARAAARAKGLRPGLRPVRRRRPGVPARERPDGRDPELLGDQVDRLVADRGWKVDVAVGSVMGRWPEIVGPDVASHCTPVTFEGSVLTVRADSTAWATQIRMLSSSILGRLETEVGKGTVTELKVHGPSAPSWSRGPRRSQGPGPRDTYG